MIELFKVSNEYVQLKQTSTSIATSDNVTYISTQNAIFSITDAHAMTKIYACTSKIKEIYSLADIHIIVIVYNDYVELRNINDINNEQCPQFRKFDLTTTGISIWNNMNTSHLNIDGTSADLISLATAVPDDGKDQDLLIKKSDTNLITYLSLISKTQIIVVKWLNSQFVDRYNLYISNIRFLEFIKIDELVCVSNIKQNTLIRVNLLTSKIKHEDITKILNVKTSLLPFSNSSQLQCVKSFNNQLVFVKHDEIIHMRIKDKTILNTFKISNTHFKLCRIIFPFIFMLYDNHVEVRSMLDSALFQTIDLICIVELDFHDSHICILCKDKVWIFNRLSYDVILQNLYTQKDYNNAIFLIENTDICNIYDQPSGKEKINPKKLKFIKLRKFKLLKATELLNSQSSNDFADAIDLAAEFLATPKSLISNLPNDLKALLDSDAIKDNKVYTISSQEKYQINQLIRFFADSRRKLLRLLENKYTEYNYNNLEISLSIYQESDKYDSGDQDVCMSTEENLQILDTYLFRCYLLANIKMINPFLRHKIYCDANVIETTCLALGLIDQLITFYTTRKEYEKPTKLLIELNKPSELIVLFQNLIQLNPPPLDLIFSNIDYLISLEDGNFDLIFLNKNLDYSHIDYKKVIEIINNSDLKRFLIRYLEYLVFHQEIATFGITNELFKAYFNDITKNFEKIEKLYEFGNYNANHILRTLKSLPSSHQSKKLMIPPLIKLGKYDDILNIYIYDLNDIKGSVEFCLSIRKIKNDSLSKGLVFKVMDSCLLTKDYTSIVKFILNNSELDFINFEEILIKLPSEISTNLMSSFLIMNLKKLNTINHNLIIRNELLKSNVINTKLNKMNLERKMIKVTQNSICIKCGRSFNKSEILCFHPNGNIVHYKCSKEK